MSIVGWLIPMLIDRLIRSIIKSKMFLMLIDRLIPILIKSKIILMLIVSRLIPYSQVLQELGRPEAVSRRNLGSPRVERYCCKYSSSCENNGN